jgi:hypothetical protein
MASSAISDVFERGLDGRLEGLPLMTETDVGAHNGRRVLRTVEPMQTIERLNTKIRQLHEEIRTVLDGLVEADRLQCSSSIPAAVLRGLRLTQYHYPTCLCAWLKAEHEQCCQSEVHS